ncbi:MAG: hypothetical protein RIE77_13285 [Phycisphaerales bacterium]|jgi:hypothetical protein
MTDQPTQDLMDRKAEILQLGQQAVARRGEQRRTRNHAVAMVLLTASATVLAYAMIPMRIGQEPTTFADGGAPAPKRLVAYVSTTSGLAESLATPALPTIERIVTSSSRIARVQTRPVDMADHLTDQQALALLREAGKPAGLVKVGGRVTLVYHDRPESDLGPSGHGAVNDHATLAALRPYRPM